ncbi:hypothetical protein IAR50_001335 [Cryptococcus sp. DSM 104548]
MRSTTHLLSALLLAATAAMAGNSSEVGNVYAGAPTDGITVYAEDVSQCGVANISWTGANPPVTVEIAEGGYYIGRTSVANLTTGANDYFTEWLVDVAAGQSLIFQVVDADGNTGYVQNINVTESDDASCVKFGASNGTSSAASNGTSEGVSASGSESATESASTAYSSSYSEPSSATSSASESIASSSEPESSSAWSSSASRSSTSASAASSSSASPSSTSAQAAASTSTSSSGSSSSGVVAVNDSSSTTSGSSSSSSSSTSSSSSASRVAVEGWSVLGAVLGAIVLL